MLTLHPETKSERLPTLAMTVPTLTAIQRGGTDRRVLSQVKGHLLF
ncbi:MAG: hypothetical protein K2H22_00920 [Muribaculaceae bacterium]|nr:hypothetical protein [Muribaculaceae bacterium]